MALLNNITVAPVVLEDLEAPVATKAALALEVLKAAREVIRVVPKALAVPVAQVVTRADLGDMKATEAMEAPVDPADLRAEYVEHLHREHGSLANYPNRRAVGKQLELNWSRCRQPV